MTVALIRINCLSLLFSLFLELAQIFNQAGATARFAGDAGITAVQNKPVMHIQLEFCRDMLEQFLLHLVDILTGGKTGAVGNAENMGIYGYGGPAEGGIEHHVGGLAAHTG